MERVTQGLATMRHRAPPAAPPALDDCHAGSISAVSGCPGTCLPGGSLAGKAVWLCPSGRILPMRAESVRTPGGRLPVRAPTRARVGARQPSLSAQGDVRLLPGRHALFRPA